MLISGSSLDCERAGRSYLFNRCMVVPSVGLSPNPYDFPKEDGRRKWNISEDRKVIFCGATYISSERKGFHYLFRSLEILESMIDVSKVTVLVAGTDSDKIAVPEGYDVKRVGILSYENLFRAYCCSDLFVCPSLEDSGPMMINYSVMASIPVVCFRMGISLDIVRHKENGYIAKWGDCEDFAQGIKYCLESGLDREVLKSVSENILAEIRSRQSISKVLSLPV